MAQGDSFWGVLKDLANATPVLGAYTQALWGPGNYNPNTDPNAKPEDVTPLSLVSGIVPTQSLGFLTDKVTNAPVVGAPMKFVLDFGMRTADSMAGMAEHVGSTGDASLESWASGWRRAWDSWGTDVHASAGQIISNALQSDARPDPFSKQGVAAIDATAHKTWYGEVAGGVADLTAGFITPGLPLKGVARGLKAGGDLDTLAKVQVAEETFNKASKAGELDKLKVGRGKAFVPAALGVPVSGETYAARLRDAARDVWKNSTDPTAAMNYLGPRMNRATDQSKRILAETAAYARTLPEDMGTHVIGNTWLALMGSEKAAGEVINFAPTVMDKIANATGAPVDLKIIGDAQEKLLQAHLQGGDVRLSAIMNDVFETPQKQATAAAIRGDLENATRQAEMLSTIRGRIQAARPTLQDVGFGGKKVDKLDVARLKEARSNAIAQHASRVEDLRAAKADGSDPARIKDLQDQVAQAKADRDLLNSTPLHDPAELDKWRATMTATKRSQKQADYTVRWHQAELRTAQRQIQDDVKQAQAITPALNATNLWLKDVMGVQGGIDVSTAHITPTLLDRAKTGMRDWIGKSYLYDGGDYTARTIFHVHPTEWVANIGTAYGRRAVNTHDLYKGQQELGMYLKKSGVYSGDEIRGITNQFLSSDPNKVAEVVQHVGDEMTHRMLLNAGFPEETIGQTIKLMRHTSNEVRSYLTGVVSKAETDGSRWVKTNEFPDQSATSANHMLDTAFTRAHLSDTVAFPDPGDVQRFIHLNQKKYSLLRAKDVAAGMNDEFNYWWKTFNLVRPGLFFRNMVDTELRAAMIVGSMAMTSSAVNGSLHKMRNSGVKVGDWTSRGRTGSALERIGLRLGPQDLTKHVLGDSGVTVDIGNGQTRTLNLHEMQDGHATAASMAAVRGAATQGASMGESIMGSAQPLYQNLVKDASKWDKYKATDPRWEGAYRDHAQQLLASPTARKMIEDHITPGDAPISGPERMRRLFSDPKVKDEYNRLAAEMDMTREQFIEQLDWEMGNMFPEPGMAEAVLSGKLQGAGADKWIKDHFPPELRFDVPGKESVLRGATSERGESRAKVKKWMDTFYKNVIDEPDYWLVRHPVMVRAYSDQVKTEASQLLAARRAKFGDQATIDAKDIETINRRARNHAIGVVKDYMYDSTYNTYFSQSVHRIAPFFNPWYDAMRAYSKLIYDNPNRLGNMSGLWNAPTNLSQWMPEPLVVDINGNALHPGQEPDQGNGERFFVISSLLGGKKPFGIDLKLRQSSFNTILMGNTPWLPGWGPTATVPLAAAINTNKDFALALSTTKNPVAKLMMESLWPDGQIPQSDIGSLGLSITPAIGRKLWDLVFHGKTYWTNVQYGLNQRYVESVKNGTPFDQAKAAAEAENDASKAGLLSVISQGIFGISAKSDVSGQFYVDQMRQLEALPPEAVKAAGFPSVQAMFMAKFPEAANLTWTFSRNETGINATAVAQSEANRLRSVIETNPDMGWFVVGAENVGGEFSQTAYNQQKQFAYGLTQEGRKTLESGDVMKNTLAGIGWDQYMKIAMQIEQVGAQYGFKAQAIAATKSQIAQMIGAQNPTWFEAYNQRENKLADFFNKADLIAKDPRMAGRQDIGMYREYRAARQQVLDALGLKSLGGTGPQSVQAKAVLYQIGTQMASQNIGFQQMWERMLSNEVEPKGGALNGDAAATGSAV